MKVKSNLIKVGLISIASIAILSTSSHAALQSRPGGKSTVSKTPNWFFTNIRNMEATIGFNPNIDTTSYLDSSNNGVDVHMAKNTEWGTAAMLAASSYGYAPEGQSDESTTGNATGVYQMANGTYEYVAGIYQSSSNNTTYWGTIKTANGIYYNDYGANGTSGKSIAGDATTETAGWKGASYSNFVNSSNPVFARSSRALFGYVNNYGNESSNYSSRAVLVAGAGL